MYWAYLCVTIWAVTSSWWRFRTVLHPQFVFTVLVVVIFMSDFLVRAYADEVIRNIAQPELAEYQAIVLLFTIVLLQGSYLYASTFHRVTKRTLKLNLELSGIQKRILAIAAWLVLSLEILQRLYCSHWSITEAIFFSIGPRGAQPWKTGLVNLGDSTFLYTFVTMLLPFSGIGFAYLLSGSKRLFMGLSLVGFGVVLALLVSNGSRTPVVLAVAAMAFFYAYKPVSTIKKIMMISGSALLIAALCSLMYLYRSDGLVQILLPGTGVSEQYTLLYHQDNSYYWALSALHRASITRERWDPVYFVYAVVSNPIPRFFWADKPALLQEYWGNYKDYWVTITFLGELVAMFGPWVALFIGWICGFILYRLLVRAAKALGQSAGVLVYVVVILYVYMIMRSLMNVTQFMYFPLFAWAVFRYMKKRHIKREVTRYERSHKRVPRVASG